MQIFPYQLSKMKLTDQLTLAGYSVGGEESVILCPELNVCFDIGRCPREALTVDNVLLTHGHTDHSVGLLYYFAQRDFQGIEGGRAFVPKTLVKPLEQLLATWGKIDGKVPPHDIIGIEPGQDIPLRRDLVARTFPTNHRVGSLGYCIIEVRSKLKPEFDGKSGPELVELKNQGVEITNRIEMPLVAWLGDTAPGKFSEIPCLRDVHTLIIECTFFEKEHKKRAKQGKHIHIDALADCLEGLNNHRIIIAHVTRRTLLGEARKVLKAHLSPELLKKVRFLMDRRYLKIDE